MMLNLVTRLARTISRVLRLWPSRTMFTWPARRRSSTSARDSPVMAVSVDMDLNLAAHSPNPICHSRGGSVGILRLGRLVEDGNTTSNASIWVMSSSSARSICGSRPVGVVVRRVLDGDVGIGPIVLDAPSNVVEPV